MKLSGILFIFRIKNLSKAISRFEDFLFADEITYNIISFVRLICSILLFAHWSACFWVLLGKLQSHDGWIEEFANSSSLTQYVKALYYVVVVINTVGFGDMVPSTNIEIVFTIVFIFVACMIFAITLSRVGI